MTTQRSVVLVHGAWHGAWCWDKVVSGLNRLGIASTAVELPFTGFEADVAAARDAIAAAGPDTIVVGHSYGGLVISAAARGLTNVGRLVYLCAFMLAEDDQIGALLGEHPSSLTAHLRIENGRTIVDADGAAASFYNDCAPADVAASLARLRSVPQQLFGEGGRPAWREVPSTYVVCTEDRAIVPGLQRHMSRRATDVTEWPTSHSPFVSQPQLVIELLERLTRA